MKPNNGYIIEVEVEFSIGGMINVQCNIGYQSVVTTAACDGSTLQFDTSSINCGGKITLLDISIKIHIFAVILTWNEIVII